MNNLDSKNPRMWLILAAVSGFLCVALGAMGSHAFRHIMDERGRALFQTAVLYQMFHTGALLALGLLLRSGKNAFFQMAGCAFVVGIILFSGSLYALAVSGIRWLGAITPIGGVSFLAGWAVMIFGLAKSRN